MKYIITNIYKNCNRYNYIYCIITDANNKVLDKEVYDISGNYEGIRTVRIGDKFTFIKDGADKISGKQKWYNYCDRFISGYAIVKIGNKYNFVDHNFKLLSPNLWFNSVTSFDKSMAVVGINFNYGLIDTNGKLVLDIIYDIINRRSDSDYFIQLYKKGYIINDKMEVI